MNKDQECYPLRISHLPEYFYQKARKELNETPETREVELNKLKDLLSADKLTAGIEFEEDFLHQFLRHSKYNALKAFQYLQKSINFRRNYSSIFENVPEEQYKGNPSTKFICLLPYRCPEGCAIIFQDLSKWNPSELSLEHYKRLALSSALQELRSPMTQICGFKMIYDFDDTMKLMRFCTPQNMLLSYNAAFKGLPARYKEFHFINNNAVLAGAWILIKRLLSEKLRKRVFFHSNPEDLLNHFPSSIIPIQYGGSLVNYYDTELMAKMNEDHGNCPEGGQPNYS